MKKSGFSIIEVIVASLILSIVGLGFIKGIRSIEKNYHFVQTKNSKEEIIQSIINQIRENLNLAQVYQSNTSSLSDRDILRSLAKLPSAWGALGIQSTQECEKNNSCQEGRLAFLIRPHTHSNPEKSIPKLLKVTVLLKHPTLLPENGLIYTFAGAQK